MNNQPVRVGVFTGTAAAINISIGWVPDHVKIVNITDADIMHESFLISGGSAAGTSIDTAAAVATNAADGITAYDGDSTHAPGFTVGTDISESAKVYGYVATRNI